VNKYTYIGCPTLLRAQHSTVEICKIDGGKHIQGIKCINERQRMKAIISSGIYNGQKLSASSLIV
jgi:hypothetical protein